MNGRRPTAREIVDAVVQAMHDAHEPLDERIVLVPSIYDVLIHPAAYRQLDPILGRIHSQATQRLERELERLNRSTGVVAGRFLQPLLRLFYPDHRLRRLQPGAQTVERTGEEWVVDVLVTADPSARMDFLAVEADFGGRISPVMRGDTDLQIRRRTTRLSGGGYETILVTPRDPLTLRGAADGNPSSGRQHGTGDGMGDEAGHASRVDAHDGKAHASVVAAAETLAHGVAKLEFEDREGRHTIFMEKPCIVIGRGAEADVVLSTESDVSREHVVIRREAATFQIKNLGRYGTRVDGRPLDPGEDWHPLPEKAEIILADAVSIHFAVLP